MLTQTTLSAIRALIYISRSRERILSPRSIATALEESPTYMAKIVRQLVKAGILRAVKGVKGGVQIGRPPGEVSLLAVVEACQGVLVGDFCEGVADLGSTCAYHKAMAELHEAMTGVLSRWSVAQLMENLKPRARAARRLTCRLRWTAAEPAFAPGIPRRGH
jgi:Rrf2 family nitric oxide-sensitive transcriptional repressor